MQQVARQHERSNAFYLWQAYARPSQAKEKAFAYCVDLMRKYNGYDLRITGYNTSKFSVAFKFTDENGALCMAYITADNDRYFEL